jgi:ABC-type multidrug transport system fused ATPase/permease subunit
LTTVEKCNCIFELAQGRVISEGSFEKLLLKSSSFRQMAARK